VVGSFGDGLFAYLLPVYMRTVLGADPVQLGLLYALTALAAASTLLISGALADRYDRKKIMIAGWLAWLPAPLIFAFSKNWIGMIPGMVLWGFWLGQPSGSAYVVTSAERSRLTQTFTIISAGWSLGYVFSPALGGFLAGTVGYKVVFYLAFIFYSSACLTLSFIRSQCANHNSDASREDYSFRKLLRNRKLLSMSMLFSALMFVIMMFRNFVPTYLADVYRYKAFEIGVLGSILFTSSAVLGILLGRLGDLKRKSYPLAISLMLSAAAMVLMMSSGNFGILAVCFAFYGGSYIIWSMLGAVVGPTAPESSRARWISVPQTFSMFASFAAPFIGGFLYSASAQYPFIVAGIMLPILALLSIRILKE